MASAGLRFAQALAAKDPAAISALLTADVDFKALTPGRFWDAVEPDATVEILLGRWFPPQDEIDELLEVSEGDPVEDTAHVSYRFALTTPDGPHTAEQQVYYRVAGERISYLRVLCSGFRPVD